MLKPPDKDYINWYKTNVSLPDFAKDHYGFLVRKDKSSVNYPVLYHPVTGDKFVFKINSRNQFTFFSPLNDSFRGNTVWDFVRYMESFLNPGAEVLTFSQMKSILDSYITSENYIRPGQSQYLLKSASKQSVFSPYDLKPLTDLSYLKSRQIRQETIVHPYFKGKIFNHLYSDPGNDVTYTNTAFVLTDLSGSICALSLKNNNVSSEKNLKFQHLQGSRSIGLFLSNNTAKLDVLIITESAIDALSHFQMNSNDLLNKSVLYLSTEGSLCEGQLLRIQQIVENQKPSKILFGFDNDIAGLVYNVNVLGSVNYSAVLPPELSATLPKILVKPIVDKQHACGKVFFSFENSSKREGEEHIKWLEKSFADFNKNFSNSYHDDTSAISVTLHQLTDHSCQGLISFENNKSLWKHMFEFVHYVKFERCPVFELKQPFSKDWNDDLQIMLNVHPKYSLYVNEKGDNVALPKENIDLKSDTKDTDINKQTDKKSSLQRKDPKKPFTRSL